MVLSPHLVQLRDPSNDKVLPQPIHINRVKLAYVRHPSPTNYHKVLTKIPTKIFSSQSTQTDIQTIVETDRNEVQTDRDNVMLPDANDSAQTLTDTDLDSTHKSSSESTPDHNQPKPVTRQSRRTIRKPLRYRDSDHVDPFAIQAEATDQNEIIRKVKRVLAQRHSIYGLQYLVQIVGEPAQSTAWILASSLDKKAKTKATRRPPPSL